MWTLALHPVSYAGVWPGQAAITVDAFIDRAAELGYDGVLLMVKRGNASVLGLGPDRRCALRKRLRKRGLELAGIASYTAFTAGAERPDIPLREMQILDVHECARLTHDLWGHIVRTFTGYEQAGLNPGQSWTRCVQAVKECARRAADYVVTLAVHNHHDIAVHCIMRRCETS